MTIRSAIILAAGRGSRLDAHTGRQPKCLARLGGRSLLDWQVDALHAAGVDDITVVAGYRAQSLRKREGLRVVINPAWEHTGPIASLLCADPAVYAAGFFLVYGDGVFHPQLIQALNDIPEAIGITSDTRWQQLWSERFAQVLDDAERLRCVAGRLVEIGGRAQSVQEIEGNSLAWSNSPRKVGR
jgi:choline kinase